MATKKTPSKVREYENKVKKLAFRVESQTKTPPPRKASLEAHKKFLDLGITPKIIERSTQLTPLEKEILLLRLKTRGSWTVITNQLALSVDVGPSSVANASRAGIKKLIREGLIQDPTKKQKSK